MTYPMDHLTNEWIAVVLKDHRTPVGAVVENADGRITIDLISACYFEPMGRYVSFSHSDVLDYVLAANNGVLVQDQALWDFQGKWERFLGTT